MGQSEGMALDDETGDSAEGEIGKGERKLLGGNTTRREEANVHMESRDSLYEQHTYKYSFLEQTAFSFRSNIHAQS